MQNKSKLLFVIFFITTWFLQGCDKKDSNKLDSQEKNTAEQNYYSDIGDWKVPTPVLTGKRKKHIARPSIQVVNDKLATLYSTSKEVILSYDNQETILEEKGGAKQLWLFSNKNTNNIYAFWWKKTKKGKRLYFRGSTDLGKTFSKKVIINNGGGVLPTIDFSSDTKGNLVVAYYDERHPPYQIFTNISSDNGKTWGLKDFRADNDKNARMKKIGDQEYPMAYAINPILRKIGDDKLLLVWQQRKIVDGRSHLQFASRVSTDFGKIWGDEQIIYTAKEDYPVEAALASNGKDVVLVAAFSTTSGLLGFHAENIASQKAFKWVELGPAPETVKVNEISVLKPAISNNKFKLSYSIKKESSDKYGVEAATIDLGKVKWDSSFRLDRLKKQAVATKATYHDLKVLPNGEFVIAWEDYRRLIPMLMIDYTTNNGMSWQKEPLAMTRGGLSTIKYPSIYVGKKNIWAVFEWYVYGGEKLPRLSKIKVALDDKKDSLKLVSAPFMDVPVKDLKSNLRERVAQLMDLRVQKKWKETWEYMDPVYQLVTNKSSWLSNMGYILYDDYKITSVKVDGIFATVEMDLTVSLRQQFRGDDIMEQTPPKKTHTTTKWLYFYNQWYLFPSGSFSPHLSY